MSDHNSVVRHFTQVLAIHPNAPLGELMRHRALVDSLQKAVPQSIVDAVERSDYLVRQLTLREVLIRVHLRDVDLRESALPLFVFAHRIHAGMRETLQ